MSVWSSDVRLWLSLVWVWAVIYGLGVVLIEATQPWVLCALLVGPLASYLGCRWGRLQPPSLASVEAVLGADPLASPGLPFLQEVGHRFAGLDAPENTLHALEICHKKGCKAVEFDIALTSDGVPIVFHDDTIDRLTNERGEVSRMTWDQLSHLDLSVNHHLKNRFAETHIPLFEDVIEKCLEYDMRLIIDVKDSNQILLDAIIAMFEKHPNLYKRAMVTSFNPLIIYNIRSRKPGIVCSMSWRPAYMSQKVYDSCDESKGVPRSDSVLDQLRLTVMDWLHDWAFFHLYHYFLGLTAVLLHKDVITPILVSDWKKKGVRVMAWTVNRGLEKEHCSHNLQITYLTDTIPAN